MLFVAISKAAGSTPDPEDLPAKTIGAIFFFAAAGWSAIGLQSLALLLQEGLAAKLKVFQEILASIFAGVVTFLAFYYLLEWSKMASYIADFTAAYGGAKYLDQIKDLFIDSIRAAVTKAPRN